MRPNTVVTTDNGTCKELEPSPGLRKNSETGQMLVSWKSNDKTILVVLSEIQIRLAYGALMRHQEAQSTVL